MVRGDAVDDEFRLAEPFGDLRAHDGVRTFDLVAHRLADVVEESGALGRD